MEDALRGSAIFGEDDASDDREASWGSLSEQEPELQAPSHVLKRFSLRGSSALSRRAACSGPKRRHLSASGTDHCTGSVKILFKFRVARIAGVKLIDLRASSTRPPGKPVVIGLGRVGPPVPVTRLATKTHGWRRRAAGRRQYWPECQWAESRQSPPFRLGISEPEASSHRAVLKVVLASLKTIRPRSRPWKHPSLSPCGRSYGPLNDSQDCPGGGHTPGIRTHKSSMIHSIKHQ